MGEFFNVFIKAAFVENLVLAYFLGMCSYLAVSKTVKTAFGLGLAVIFVLGITMPINWLINTYLLKPTGILGQDLTFLRLILFIAVIASMVQ
ncbi:MAG: Rnf-Nqr domain containing protein, partial [Bacteroidota bacterium]